jgi:hypothetical protein
MPGDVDRERNDSSWSSSMKDGELSVLLASDSSMKKDEAVGQGDGASGSSDTNLDGDATLLSRFLSSR